ncbi:OLC1v1009249C1 [Oldenlandia corymbosa var. corymbosa]|uniref:Dirigent protein n=1 Tax=Oldenlandia corymbosa var. corymbosa TaxID=529605 RepID=A0AAV1DRN6_OLDCO|nr:OLC1v1009249C1 [Oldenlandia corymbosa var. corymbosa]
MSQKLCSILFLVFVISSFRPIQSRKYNPKKPCKRFSVHMHEILFDGNNAANATAAVAVNQTKLNSYGFGEFTVFNDKLTADSNLSSPSVGRGQGFYVFNMRTPGFNAWVGLSLVFNNSFKYKGTLTITGADLISQGTRDIPIVGGTGDFFMARGIATITTEFEGDTYFRLLIDVKLYEC